MEGIPNTTVSRTLQCQEVRYNRMSKFRHQKLSFHYSNSRINITRISGALCLGLRYSIRNSIASPSSVSVVMVNLQSLPAPYVVLAVKFICLNGGACLPSSWTSSPELAWLRREPTKLVCFYRGHTELACLYRGPPQSFPAL
jgi:hypothetical protein